MRKMRASSAGTSSGTPSWVGTPSARSEISVSPSATKSEKLSQTSRASVSPSSSGVIVLGARNSGIAEKEGSLVFGLISASSIPCDPNSHRGHRGVKDHDINYTCFHERLLMGPTPPSGGRRRMFPVLTALVAGALAAGCGSGEVKLPTPRPIVVTSGERLRAEPARMDSIYAWLTAENTNIEEDPSFLIEGVPAARQSMPWQTLTINEKADTARFQYDRAHPDVTTAFNVYAHLHLMKRKNLLADWLPDHASAEGYDL